MNETVEKLMNAYDIVPYKSYAHLYAHPDRLAVSAALGGVLTRNVENCRVLEIGCGVGGNLLPMAEQLPRSTFLGIDLSTRQIEAGSAVIRELGLKNVELRRQDLMEFPDDAGQFDYILAHGVYSWVPAPVRHQLLRICRRHLAPRGVAYISYNTYPGCRLKEVAREMMLYRTRFVTDPAQRVALGRQIVQLVADHTPIPGFYKETMRFLQGLTAGTPDQSILHDHMELVNDPQYFWRFVEEAEANGLAFIGNANDAPDPWLILPVAVREALLKISLNPLDREQYLDFFIDRSFRGTVLCLAEAAAAATSSPVGRIRAMCVAGNPREKPAGTNQEGRAVSEFGSGGFNLSIADPGSLAVLRQVCRAWPMAVAFSDLLPAFANQLAPIESPEKLTEDLERAIDTCHGMRLVELWSRPTSMISPATDPYPRATRYARWQAAHNLPVTSLRHTPIALDLAIRPLILLLDGSRDRQALVSELVRQIGPAANPQHVNAFVQSALQTLAESSLLISAPKEN